MSGSTIAAPDRLRGDRPKGDFAAAIGAFAARVAAIGSRLTLGEPAYYDSCAELLGGVARDLEEFAGELLMLQETSSAAERREIRTELAQLRKEVSQLARLLAAARDFYAGGWHIAGSEDSPYSAGFISTGSARLLVCQG